MRGSLECLSNYNGDFEMEIAQTNMINLMQLQLGFNMKVIYLIR